MIENTSIPLYVPKLTNKCLWRRSWSPHPSLLPCHITHCPDLPSIPTTTNLEEADDHWAKVGKTKTLRCKGIKEDLNHTMFFETDRSKSEMLLDCLENGSYAHVEEWPVCLQGDQCWQSEIQKCFATFTCLIEINEPFSDITCPLPPHIPINEHYREVKEAQVYSLNKEVRNSPNKIPREESMRRASLIHPEKQFLRRSRRLFHDQTSRATSTLLSGS